MPYRIDLSNPREDVLDLLVALGALDVELVAGGIAALMPDGVASETLASALGLASLSATPAIGRDDGSTWILIRRPIRVGGLWLVPAEAPAPAGALRLGDGPAFGTGLHASTALCLDALEQELLVAVPASVLDVGTGSGVLALAALLQGVPEAVGLDVDPEALRVAGENARVNECERRLRLVQGGPDAVDGLWPLVLANVAAAPLTEMAPQLARRVGHGGRLILAGMPQSLAPDIDRAYRRQGMQHVRSETRAGWTAVVFQASW